MSLLKEKEAAKDTVKIVREVKEVHVVDSELMEKLKSENEKLKVGNWLYSFCFPEITKDFKVVENIWNSLSVSYAVPGKFAGAED